MGGEIDLRTAGPATGGRHRVALRSVERGPRIAALFDFDGTIIAGYSAFALLQERVRRGEMSAGEMLGTLDAMARYAAGMIDFSGLMTAAAAYLKGVSEERFVRLGEHLFERHIARRIYPETRAIIRAHQAKGHTVAIVSSATVYQIAPTARELGVERILCSRYEVERGRFTGRIVRPLCFGTGKRIAAEALAVELGLDLDRSYFYSDSDDDLELLERVGKPRPLNPNDRLQTVATERGWPVQRFSSRGTPGIRDYLRGLAPTPTLVGAFLAGLPIWAMTRSARETTNFVFATFGDVAGAIIGIDLEVRGEKYLWSARPCIFLFNHQSQADFPIMAKLVRRDFTGIGKKEIRDIPVIGRLMQAAGMVFVDRSSTPDAVQAMAPLVEAMQRDGKSVCIAPEGSRSLTGKLAPFKKGAFHLAIQAGVPIVPVVIHNSADVQPKNEFAMRPATVRVDVLPPIDTSRWRVAAIERHVSEVRKLFLHRLGQPEEAAPRRTRKPRGSRSG